MKKSKLLSLALILSLVFGLSLPVMASNVSWQGLSGEFTLFGNMTPYYTGPAAAKAVLNYDQPTKFTQSQLADWMGTNVKGTYLANLATVLNANLSSQTVDVYNGHDYDTVIYSLYDTVVRQDLPAIIGVNSSKKAGWPYDMKSSRFVLVYGVSTDLKSFKIGDPTGIQSSTDDIENFYVVSASTLYDAYVRANTGMTFVVNEEEQGIDIANFPAGSISLRVTPENGSLSKGKFQYHIINNSDYETVFGTPLILEKYNSKDGSWSEVKPPTQDGVEIAWNYIALIVKAHKVGSFDLLFDIFQPGPGTYRLIKNVSVNNTSFTLYSNSFVLSK